MKRLKKLFPKVFMTWFLVHTVLIVALAIYFDDTPVRGTPHWAQFLLDSWVVLIVITAVLLVGLTIKYIWEDE